MQDKILRDWIVEVEAQPTSPPSYSIHLALRDPESGRAINISAPCRSIEELMKEISILKTELDGLLGQAKDALGRLKEEKGNEGTGPDPKGNWEEMEAKASEEEMFAYFNSFPVEQRKKVAEYIFGHVNMFHGRGPVFAASYDNEAHVLE